MILRIDLDGKKHSLEGQIIGGQAWFHFEGQTYTMPVSNKKSRRAGQAASSGSVIAPMPGKIAKVFVSENQKISVGTPVLVMEAMKMEYTLKAEVDGVVKKLDCQVGEQVVLGKLLAQIEPLVGKLE
ncbi:MAG: acetyl-CoA carboxylase biotin carboxyl carrier protein subunit [Pseudobdellovibrionaceae bacterium]